MTTFTTDIAGHEVAASCLLGSRLSGTGACAAPTARPAPLAALPVRGRAGGRVAEASAVAAEARVDAYAPAFAADGADSGQKQAQHRTMWAFRGLEPWRDPA